MLSVVTSPHAGPDHWWPPVWPLHHWSTEPFPPPAPCSRYRGIHLPASATAAPGPHPSQSAPSETPAGDTRKAWCLRSSHAHVCSVVKSTDRHTSRCWSFKNVHFPLRSELILKQHWLVIVFTCSTDTSGIGYNEYVFMDNNNLILTRLRQYSDWESTM